MKAAEFTLKLSTARLSDQSRVPYPFQRAGNELMVIWKGWFETAPCRATLATPFPALYPRILGTRFTNYGLRMFWGELKVIWKGWFETVPCRATLNTPFSALCPRLRGTRFTNYGLRVSGNPWERREKRSKKRGNSLQRKKTRKSKKARKGRSG